MNSRTTLSARVLLVVVTNCLTTLGPLAQAPVVVAPVSFEVVSVKPNNSGKTSGGVGISPNGRFTATNATLEQLITNAYDTRLFQLVGGPSWIASDRFDILASVGHDIKPTPETQAQVRTMLKNLFADRFKLTVHTETKELPIYNLVLARPDGTLGPKLRTAEIDCDALMEKGERPPVPAPGVNASCGVRMNDGRLSGKGGRIVRYAREFSRLTERHVVDKTGLRGAFDFDLEWSPDSGDTKLPSLFTAVQEQLGLKLESARGPVDVLVIDRVEHPVPD